ncbi:MAG TPA: transposase [Streptosporangiaceae bacterium]|nr:transposase [Streptosporangiaceae bacterium]
MRCRIDLKYALGLDLDDPGFHHSVPGDFRDRLLEDGRADRLGKNPPAEDPDEPGRGGRTPAVGALSRQLSWPAGRPPGAGPAAGPGPELLPGRLRAAAPARR